MPPKNSECIVRSAVNLHVIDHCAAADATKRQPVEFVVRCNFPTSKLDPHVTQYTT